MNFAPLRDECLQANLDLVSRGLVDMTFGNVSVCDAEAKVFAIKPSGVDYSKLAAADMVIVDLAGEIVDGYLRPSSDTPTHRRLYLAFLEKGVRSVAHTHSRNAVAFAQAGRCIPCLGTTHGDFFFGSIPVTRQLSEKEVNGDYEWETGNVIVESLENVDPSVIPGVLVHSHGPFAWGENGNKAVEHACALELAADLAGKTYCINPSTESLPEYLLNRHFRRKHGETRYYGQLESDRPNQ